MSAACVSARALLAQPSSDDLPAVPRIPGANLPLREAESAGRLDDAVDVGLPPRSVRIRHYGLLATRRRTDLDSCRDLLGVPPITPRVKDARWVAAFKRLFDQNAPALSPVQERHPQIRQVLRPLRM